MHSLNNGAIDGVPTLLQPTSTLIKSEISMNVYEGKVVIFLPSMVADLHIRTQLTCSPDEI